MIAGLWFDARHPLAGAFLGAVVAFGAVSECGASNHLDTPLVTANPQANIGDIYAWTARDGRHLNLVMDIVGRSRFAASLEPNPLVGITESLRSCRVPTRIVWGMSDRIFSPGNVEYLVSVLPRVTGIRKIEGAKLFFPEELPEVIAQEATTLWTDQV